MQQTFEHSFFFFILLRLLFLLPYHLVIMRLSNKYARNVWIAAYNCNDRQWRLVFIHKRIKITENSESYIFDQARTSTNSSNMENNKRVNLLEKILMYEKKKNTFFNHKKSD